jgi:hypothetical protein
MAFECPDCSRYSLGITNSIELRPPGAWSDLSLQLVACSHCRLRGAAVYLESRAGTLDREIVRHLGYRLDHAAVDEVERRILICPKPKDRRCGCSAHRSLAAKYDLGEPVPFRDVGGGDSFPIRLPSRHD